MRLCIIGNSHITALKQAWDEDRSRIRPFTPTFFGSYHFQMDALQYESGRFFAGSDLLATSMKQTSAGLSEFKVDDYDAFVLVGLGLKYRPFDYYGTHRLPEDAGDEYAPMSLACLAEIIKATIGACLLAKISEQIRSATKAPMIFLPVPHPTIGFLDAEFPADELLGEHQKMVQAGIAARLYPLFVDECRALAGALDAMFVNQPEKTVEDVVCSKTSYSRLIDPRGAPDYLHMNVDYGRVVLGQIKWALSKS